MRLVQGILSSYRGHLDRLKGCAISSLYHCGKVNPTGTIDVLTTSRLKEHEERRRPSRQGGVADSRSICTFFCPLVYSLPIRRY